MLTAEQAALHSSGLGGSDGAAILGCHPYRTPLDVYLEKLGLKPQMEDNKFTRWGSRLESVVAEAYAEETGREVYEPIQAPFAAGVVGEHGEVRHAQHPFIIGLPDRLVWDTDRGPGVLECKTTAGWHAKDWAEEAPLHYQVQLQHYLMLTGWGWGSLSVLIGGHEHRFLDVEAVPQFQEDYLETLVRFWEDHIVRRVPPEVDPSKDAQNLQYAFKAIAGKVVDLPQEIEDVAANLEKVNESLKALEAEKETLTTRIKAALGDAEVGRLPGGGGFTWKEVQRKGYVVEPTTVRVLRRVKKF